MSLLYPHGRIGSDMNIYAVIVFVSFLLAIT